MGAIPRQPAPRRGRRPARRRRRIAAVGIGLAALAAIAGAVSSLGGGGRPASRRPAVRRSLLASAYPVRPRPPHRRSAHPATPMAAVTSAGRAEITRLIALGLPLYCGGPRGDEVAFTFDDGPGVYTHYALKKLAEARERATFFVVGKSIEAWPGWLERELRVAAIGDHTYTHPVLTSLPPGEIAFQLERTAELIHAQTGERVDLWRPPYEATDATVLGVARRLGLLEVLWSVDSRDSLGADWLQIIHNVEAGLKPGAIVLMHENHGQTIRALSTLLPYLHRHHLRSVSVPELLASDPPSVAQLRRGWAGCNERVRPGTGG